MQYAASQRREARSPSAARFAAKMASTMSTALETILMANRSEIGRYVSSARM